MESLSILIASALKHVVLHPVKLVLIWDARPNIKKLKNSLMDYEVEDLEKANLILKNIEINGWNAVVLPKHNLKMISKSTGNQDIRGGCGGCYNFKQSDFVWEITNPSGITFGNLVEGVYRMKGSKYDLWYELFSEIKIINEDDDSYTIEAIFGYGS